MNDAHLRQILENVLLGVLVELSVERLLLDFICTPFNLVDSFPELFLLHLKVKDLLFQMVGLFT